MVDQLQHATEALRKALVQVERLKRTNRALLERSSEPIAIVGMSCRFPGASIPGRAVADGGRRQGRDVRISHRPWVGSGQVVRPGSRRAP